MPTRGKKYRQAITIVEDGRLYTLDEAIDLLERTNTVKFNPTVEIHFRLGIDPKQGDQLVRSTITLPNGSGRTVRIGVFTDQGNEKDLLALGAAVAGADELIDTVATGKIDFDIAVATPNMMRKMAKVAKVLGPKGLMPNPKSGTVGEDLAAIIREISAGKFEFKNDKQGNVHSIAGKLDFGAAKLKGNIQHFMQVIQDVRPNSVKPANYLKGIVLCTTMGPGIRIDLKA